MPEPQQHIRHYRFIYSSDLPNLFNVEVITLSPSEREAFASVARGIHDTYAASVADGPELLTLIRDALSKHRK